jgi:act minimal PKS acyl carrier protein
MSELTLTGLMRIMRECAGEYEGMDSGGDILNAEFDALGYDSIALLETAGRIQREYGVSLADDVVAEAKTPRELLGLVNKAIGDAA